MIKSVLLVCVAILAIIGLSEVIHIVRLLLASPKGAQKNYMILWLKVPCAAAQLRFAAAQRKWLGSGYAETVIAVTSGIESEKANELSRTFTDGFVFCPIEALQDILVSLSGDYINNG